MRKILMLLLLTLIISFASCSPSKIKGTDIEDTPDNKEVLKVFDEYVNAVKTKDSAKIITLISDSYYDKNGTDIAADDVDYDGIVAFMKSEKYAEILKINISIIIKDMTVDADKGFALVYYYYDLRFQSDSRLGPDGKTILEEEKPKWYSVDDVNQIQFVKENGKWLIVSGL